jgi:F-type H+-transporting ATPase subunit a
MAVLVSGWTAFAAAAGPAASAPGAGASELVHAERHGLPPAPETVFHLGPLPVTNSMVVTWIAAAGLIVFAQRALRRIEPVPSGAQNFWEWLVESLYSFLEGVIGRDLVRKTFWFFATIFIFILFTNWISLFPGVGTIGWGVQTEHGFRLVKPLFRGGNADLNMTGAMAMIFFACWTVWAFQVNGVKGVFLHIFGPKGESAGVMRLMMIVVFFAVGFLEVISILFRPVSLSFRLYGNIFAGENLLEAMATMIQHPAWAKAVFSVLLPIPFYFMELLVGFVQALVFMLLTAVFTMLICTHEEGAAGEHGH